KRTDTKEQINKSQRQWLKVRNACKNAECLKNAYETRIKKLGLLFSDDEHVLVMSKKFAANQARLLMRVLACSLLHMLRQFCLMVEEVKRSMECVIKRLVKVRARI